MSLAHNGEKFRFSSCFTPSEAICASSTTDERRRAALEASLRFIATVVYVEDVVCGQTGQSQPLMGTRAAMLTSRFSWRSAARVVAPMARTRCVYYVVLLVIFPSLEEGGHCRCHSKLSCVSARDHLSMNSIKRSEELTLDLRNLCHAVVSSFLARTSALLGNERGEDVHMLLVKAVESSMHEPETAITWTLAQPADGGVITAEMAHCALPSPTPRFLPSKMAFKHLPTASRSPNKVT